MKLFEPEAAEHFVFAVVPMNAKEGAMPDYKCIRAGDMESALNQMDGRVRPAAPHCTGRYDHLGRFCTYCPAVEGALPGRFILHPQAEAEYKASRPY
jgi:hypothetical protein